MFYHIQNKYNKLKLISTYLLIAEDVIQYSLNKEHVLFNH